MVSTGIHFCHQFIQLVLKILLEKALKEIFNSTKHLCFNITEKGQMIVPDLYNTILEYPRKYGKKQFFQWTFHENPIKYGLVLDFS